MRFNELEGYVIRKERAYDEFGCILMCGCVYGCMSVNYADKSSADGFHECVLLKYKATRGITEPWKPSHKFHFYHKDDSELILNFI